MPKGIYKRTQIQKDNIGLANSIALIGNKNASGKRSEEFKLRMKGNQNFHPLGRDYSLSEKHKENIRKAVIGFYNPNFWYSQRLGFFGCYHTKEAKEKCRKGGIKGLLNLQKRKGLTLPEKIMEVQINNWIRMGIFKGYLSQFPIGRYVVDFLIPEKRLILEVYGENWHSGFRKKILDTRRKEYLENLGYKVRIFWAKDILKFRDSYGRKFRLLKEN